VKHVYFYNPWNRFTVFIQIDMLVAVQQRAHIAILTVWGKAEESKTLPQSTETYWEYILKSQYWQTIHINPVLVKHTKDRCESSLPCLAKPCLVFEYELKNMEDDSWRSCSCLGLETS